MRTLAFVLAALLACACSESAETGQEIPTPDSWTDLGTEDAAPETADVIADPGPEAPLDNGPDRILPELPPEPDVADVGEEADDAPPVDTGPPPPQPWRSALYPDDWEPGFADEEGRFLHDFSWAGYHNGEAELPTLAGPVFEANPEVDDAGPGIQAAIDAASEAGGGVVQVPAGDWVVQGVLKVSSSNVVIRGEGPDVTRVQFTQSEGLNHASHLTFSGAGKSTQEQPLTSDADALSSDLKVADATGLSAGDDVLIGWVITDAFREDHGMVPTWQAFNDTWQPFFRRTVVEVDNSAAQHTITVDVPLRYPALTRDSASIRSDTALLSEVGIEDIGLGNAVGWSAAWAQDQVHALELRYVKDAWVRNVHSFDSNDGFHLQSGGVLVRYAKRVTVADSSMGWAQHRGGGGNGYLFEVRQSSEILFRDCVAHKGRHNFIQNRRFRRILV